MTELYIFLFGLLFGIYLMPILDSAINLITNNVNLKMQRQQIDLSVYNDESLIPEKAPLIGFDIGNGEEEFICPQDCENCEFADICEDYGAYLKLDDKANNIMSKENKNIVTNKYNNYNKIGF